MTSKSTMFRRALNLQMGRMQPVGRGLKTDGPDLNFRVALRYAMNRQKMGAARMAFGSWPVDLQIQLTSQKVALKNALHEFYGQCKSKASEVHSHLTPIADATDGSESNCVSSPLESSDVDFEDICEYHNPDSFKLGVTVKISAKNSQILKALNSRARLLGKDLSEFMGKSGMTMNKKLSEAGVTFENGSKMLGTLGYVVTGPFMHSFYKDLMQDETGRDADAVIKRLVIDRLLMTPFFSLMVHSGKAAMEHRNWDAFVLRLKAVCWLSVSFSWKYYTMTQIVNLCYVTPEMKVAFGSLCGLLCSVALNSTKPKKN